MYIFKCLKLGITTPNFHQHNYQLCLLVKNFNYICLKLGSIVSSSTQNCAHFILNHHSFSHAPVCLRLLLDVSARRPHKIYSVITVIFERNFLSSKRQPILTFAQVLPHSCQVDFIRRQSGYARRGHIVYSQ